MQWRLLVIAAAAGSLLFEGVAKLQLLWQSWAPMDVLAGVTGAAVSAAGKGALPCLRYLHECVGDARLRWGCRSGGS